MSGWIAPLVAAMVERRQREEHPISVKTSEAVRVRYEKRERTPPSSYYSTDFEVVSYEHGFSITPTKVDVPAHYVVKTCVEEYPTLNEARPFIVREGVLLKPVAFQQRRLDGEWDGFWQELNLSKHAERAIEVAEQDLKEQQ